jgi:DNA invertase Pin-like site-specific DNA recombinase
MGRKPSFDRTQLDAVRDSLGKGLGVSETAKQARVSRQTVYRIQADLAGAEAAVMRWRG